MKKILNKIKQIIIKLNPQTETESIGMYDYKSREIFNLSIPNNKKKYLKSFQRPKPSRLMTFAEITLVLILIPLLSTLIYINLIK